uniref:Piercer of microtubule wall 1 n=1 Tax=Sphenodon punctatus TaxID=8508 RepID=A0A8D0LBL3_SPHPU
MTEEEHQPEAAATGEKKAEEEAKIQRTSDCYQINPNLPTRFNHPQWFRGYRTKASNPMYRTTSMDYGGKAPTVHEMPTCFHVTSHAFSIHLGKAGMYKNNGLNTYIEKSDVTGPDNYITFFDTFDFHPSYNVSRPSHCE